MRTASHQSNSVLLALPVVPAVVEAQTGPWRAQYLPVYKDVRYCHRLNRVRRLGVLSVNLRYFQHVKVAAVAKPIVAGCVHFWQIERPVQLVGYCAARLEAVYWHCQAVLAVL